MIQMALFALAIFVVFAVVGGFIVRAIVRAQEESEPGDLPPRGIPWDDESR